MPLSSTKITDIDVTNVSSNVVKDNVNIITDNNALSIDHDVPSTLKNMNRLQCVRN